MASIPSLSTPIDMVHTAASSADRTMAAQAARNAEAGAPAAKSAEAFRKFESFVLQSFIENMLPKNAESVFGSGTAGSVWKSMLAEQIADQISRSGGIGIAKRIAGGPDVMRAPEAMGAAAPAPAPVPVRDQIRSYPEQDGERS